jgi:hypothetical protein
LNYIANFFAGVFICNCIPHLVCGLRGEPFPTPFATPRGVGESSPLVNFLWGYANVVAGTVLLAAFPVSPTFGAGCLPLFAGALAIGSPLSVHFGKVRSQSRGCK